MRHKRATGTGRLSRAVPAVMVGLVSAAALAGGAGSAAAAPHRAGPAVSGEISTIAGGPGGPDEGTNVSLVYPCDVSYSNNAVYIADGPSVKKLDPKTGWLTNLAGTGERGPIGDGGPAASASLGSECGATVDHHGNLVIADSTNQEIRVVAHHTGWYYQQHMTAGDIYKVAGGGKHLGDGGLARNAKLNYPGDVHVDAAGNLVFADTFHQRIRVIAARAGTFYGMPMKALHIYSIAGNGHAGYSGDGGPATAAELLDPSYLTFDAAGNLIISDYINDRVRVVAESTGMFYGQSMTAGDIYTIAGNGVQGFTGDGGAATAAEMHLPAGVAVDAAGNLIIADTQNARVRVVAAQSGMFYGQSMTAGDIYTIAGDGTTGSSGDGGPATAAELGRPTGVTIDGSGNLLIADQPQDRVRVVAVSTGRFYGQSMTAGDIYTVGGNGQASYSGNRTPATAAELAGGIGLAVGSTGTMAVSESVGRVQVVPSATGTLFGQAMTAGRIYNIAGNGAVGSTGLGGLGTRAELDSPSGLAIDPADNVLFADQGHSQILVVAAISGSFYGKAMTAGHIYNIAGLGSNLPKFNGNGIPAVKAYLGMPHDVTLDAAGNVLIADTGNNRIRVVAESTGLFYGQSMTAGDIYTIAGRGHQGSAGNGILATRAKLHEPEGVAVDSAGNVVLADNDVSRIRVIAAVTGTFYGQPMTAGHIYVIAGDGEPGYSGDGGPATEARLDFPPSVTVDSAGNVVIADTGNNRVRVVAASDGTFYGVAMTAGDIYTITGTGYPGGGFSGDGGPAVSAEILTPEAVTTDSAGDLLFTDTGNDRIREITP